MPVVNMYKAAGLAAAAGLSPHGVGCVVIEPRSSPLGLAGAGDAHVADFPNGRVRCAYRSP